MIIMPKYCRGRWNQSRPAYTIRAKKFEKIQRISTSKVKSEDKKEKSR